MRFFILMVALCFSCISHAKTIAESRDGTIILTNESCKAYLNAYFAYGINGNQVVSLGCWKATHENIVILWNNNAYMKYDYKEWTFK